LAAQAGVRHSLNNPHAYIDSNVTGFLNILEACRNYPVKHLIFASSSSVYGMNETTPFSEKHEVSHPVSLYAVTKRTNELMAHSYSHLFGIPVTGLRFFTVYGPWGRPDMAYFSFAEKILNQKSIDIFNYGDLKRDFTYIDDVTEGISKLLLHTPQKSNLPITEIEKRPDISNVPFRVFNIGNNQPVTVKEFVETLENVFDSKAIKNFLPMQPGDVYQTYADVDNLSETVGFRPKTELKVGLLRFAEWYRQYYH
jgi:UDP-glucuronate 4-epimerase